MLYPARCLPSPRSLSIMLVLAVAGAAVLLFHGHLTRLVSAESQPQVREFHLVTKPAQWEIAPGIVVDAWTYNGQVPGPELRVREGDTVRVIVTNELPVPTTIHWHGVDVPNAMDGVPGLTQHPIQPGETFVYEFPATNPGTRWYHTHQDTSAQLELGLYGPLIIEPRHDPNGHFDREHTIILDEKALDFTPEVAMGRAQLRNAEAGNGRGGLLQYDLFLINGKAGDAIEPMMVREGERVRLRMINAGSLMHTMHLHGHSFKVIATDGNPVPPEAQWLKDSVTIGPSERVDVEVIAHNPGVWMFHCHMPNHQDNGMMATLDYEGVPPPVEAEGHHGHVSIDHAEAASHVAVLDNRFDPRSIRVSPGTTVTWRNDGVNFHTATAFDGSFDSGNLGQGDSFAFTFTEPGTYMYFCRQHALTGQVGSVVVE